MRHFDFYLAPVTCRAVATAVSQAGLTGHSAILERISTALGFGGTVAADEAFDF
jgi:hypothetical protein